MICIGSDRKESDNDGYNIPQIQRGKESLGDEILPELEITVEQVFTQAGLR